jgi:hypothetical protein
MTKIEYNIRINQDGTISVIVGRQRESFSLLGKTKAEIYDAVRWSLISKGISVSEERLTRDLYELVWRHV